MSDFSWIGGMFAFTLVFYVLRKSFDSAMHRDCINTRSAFVKHPGAADCGNEEENHLYVSQKLFFKDSSTLIQEASILNELVGMPEL